MNYFDLAVANARAEFPRPASTKRDGQTTCCAEHAHVVESDDKKSLWRCPVCLRLFAVPHR